jgi:hypothetical protein
VLTLAGLATRAAAAGLPLPRRRVDPARDAAPVTGPTSTPLPGINLRVGGDGGLYLPPSG